MSADNGIYILETPQMNNLFVKEYRVAHCAAIDNLYWDEKTNTEQKEMQPNELVRYFGESKVFANAQKAREFAQEIAMKLPILEYGIVDLVYNKSFPEVSS